MFERVSAHTTSVTQLIERDKKQLALDGILTYAKALYEQNKIVSSHLAEQRSYRIIVDLYQQPGYLQQIIYTKLAPTLVSIEASLLKGDMVVGSKQQTIVINE